MKFDFSADRRLMQAGPTGGAPSASIDLATSKEFEARFNAYNSATTKEAKQIAFQQMIALARENDLLKAGSESAAALARATGEVTIQRGKTIAAMGQKAGEAEITLQSSRTSTEIQTLQTEAGTIFNAKMIIPNLKLGIYGMAQLLGEIFNSDGLKNWAQEKIDGIQWPEMDTSKIKNVDTSVSSSSAESRAGASADRAIGDFKDYSPEQMASVIDALQNQIHGTAPAVAAAPEVAGPSKTAVMTSVSRLIEGNVVTKEQGRLIVDAYSAAAANSGDKAVVDTKADLNLIDAMLERTLKNPELKAKVEAELKLTPAPTQTAAAPAGPTPNAAVGGV